ncbi:MAG: hypothetical protein ABUL44_03150, partial [Flavobacterium sp.]
MEETIAKTSPKEKFIALADGWKSSHPSANSARKALNHLEFPTTRTEEWKYTRTVRISSEEWVPVSNDIAVDVTSFLIPGLNADLLVFVNGRFRQDLSSKSFENGVSISHQLKNNSELEFDNIFQALGAAISTSELSIDVKEKTIVEKSLHVIHI